MKYPLLDEDTAAKCRTFLEARTSHFYHFTLLEKLASIKKSGLDPAYEGADSKYADRTFEPAGAMRFCFARGLPTGLDTANTRAREWRGYWKEHPERVVMLRTPAQVLLSKSFGLDHSHGGVLQDLTSLGITLETRLTAEQFLYLVDRHGCLSCYEAIPASKLEICQSAGSFLAPETGRFLPL